MYQATTAMKNEPTTAQLQKLMQYRETKGRDFLGADLTGETLIIRYRSEMGLTVSAQFDSKGNFLGSTIKTGE